MLKGQHYSSIHDTAWRDDGRALIVCFVFILLLLFYFLHFFKFKLIVFFQIASADGFCTAVRLSEEEVGKPLKNDEIEENLANALNFARIVKKKIIFFEL